MTRRALIVVLASSGIALAALMCRGLFVRWVQDDFWVPATVATHGFWHGEAHWYRVWSGRYAFNFVSGLLGPVGPRAGAAMAPLLIAASIATLRRTLGWPLALAATYTVLLGTPDVVQSVLWQTGVLSYALPLVAFIAWLTTTFQRAEARWWDAVVPLITAGFSETNALAQVAACVVALAFWRGKPHRAALAGSLAALIIIGVAPGNLERHAQYAPTPPPLLLIERAAGSTAMFFVDAFTRCGAPLAFLFFAAACLAPAITPRLAAAAALWAVGTAAAGELAAHAAMAIALPQRAEIVPYAALASAVVALGALAGARVRPTRMGPLLIGALAVTSIAPLIDAVATARSIPAARRFAQVADHLDAACRAAAGHDVVVRGAPTSNGTLRFLLHDPARNWWTRDYYRLRSIVGEPSMSPKPPGAVYVTVATD